MSNLKEIQSRLSESTEPLSRDKQLSEDIATLSTHQRRKLAEWSVNSVTDLQPAEKRTLVRLARLVDDIFGADTKDYNRNRRNGRISKARRHIAELPAQFLRIISLSNGSGYLIVPNLAISEEILPLSLAAWIRRHADRSSKSLAKKMFTFKVKPGGRDVYANWYTPDQLIAIKLLLAHGLNQQGWILYKDLNQALDKELKSGARRTLFARLRKQFARHGNLNIASKRGVGFRLENLRSH